MAKKKFKQNLRTTTTNLNFADYFTRSVFNKQLYSTELQLIVDEILTIVQFL